MKVIFALLSLSLTGWLEASASDFPCPDELSRELHGKAQELNRLHPLSQAESGYVDLIGLASDRPMDDLALRLACTGLARRTFRTNCPDYGYECPDPDADLIEWPAQINAWIPELKANVPALKSCPEARLNESAITAVRKFRYQRELVENRFVPMQDVSATVFFHYWQLAEAAGCSTNSE